MAHRRKKPITLNEAERARFVSATIALHEARRTPLLDVRSITTGPCDVAPRFTEDQIIGVLKEHQAGIPTAELCRKHGISDATFYNWRSRYGGMKVSDARRLRSLEDENRRLKKLLAESMLDVATLKEALGKF